MNRNGMGMGMNANRKFTSKIVSSVFAMLAAVVLLAAGARPAVGQACSQNWTGSANVWAAEGSVKVMLANQATTNQPTIPTYLDDGNFKPTGYTGATTHPPIWELNPVWSCPSTSPNGAITLQGAGNETVSFQVLITAPPGAGLTGVTVDVNFTGGTGSAIPTFYPTNCVETSSVNPNCTQASNVNLYLEGYIPYTSGGPTSMQISGDMPDPLIPFYDHYDSGNPAVGAKFSVQAGTTQAVWVNISIPPVPTGQTTTVTYTGTVTVPGTSAPAIPITLTVYPGNLPGFDAGSVNPQYADMLQSWIVTCEGEFDGGEGVSGGSPTEITLLQRYQVMAHNYDLDTWFDAVPTLTTPLLSSTAGYPSTDPTSFTTSTPSGPGATGTTSTINWTAYDAEDGPALTPGGLFSDGTSMRVFDTPFTGGPAGHNGVWTWGQGYNWTWGAGDGLPPAGLLQLYENYSEQISMHFTACQTSPTVAACGTTKPWGHPELIAYTWDQPYDQVVGANGGGTILAFQDVALFEQAMNQANAALTQAAAPSGTTTTFWNSAINPIRSFLYDSPPCATTNDINKSTSYTNQVCADHNSLSYPDTPNATAASNAGTPFTSTWVMDWAAAGAPVGGPEAGGQPLYMSYWCGTAPPPSMSGSDYLYTLDMQQGVPAESTAPAPISKWANQLGEPLGASPYGVGNAGVGIRANFWVAYKYGLDVTTPITQGTNANPNPDPVPGGLWYWTDDHWRSGPGLSNCAGSPYAQSSHSYLFYPGNELDCYNASGAVGASILPGVTLNPNGNNGISGPVASMRMEQLRRGYEDYEYLYLLGHKGCPTTLPSVQCNRSYVLTNVVNSMGGAHMTEGGMGTTSWNALNWENSDPTFISGVWPTTTPGFGGNSSSPCTDSTSGAGGLANGLPNGPTGANFGYSGGCPGEWTNNPNRYAAARVTLATDLGWVTPSATPTSIAATSGSGQSSPINVSFSNPLIATVTDAGGSPVSGATVTFTAGSGITASSSTATTNGNGVASVQATPTSVSSSLTVTASVSGVSTPASFSETGTAAAAESITASSGLGQCSPVNTPFPNPLVVLVQDANGDPVSGATVTFTPGGSGITVSSPTATTNSSGLASVTATPTTASSLTVTASVTGVSTPASFSETGEAATIAATPVLSLAGGTYPSAQSVSISDTTTGAKIYYTTNGATPTTSSTLYAGPITVSATGVNATETIQAIAVASGYTQSAVGSATYNITVPTTADTPTFSPAAGTYSSTQTVTILEDVDASEGAAGAAIPYKIYYTTNGTTPTTSSPVYSAPITVSSSETIEAIATATGYTQSAVGSAAYTINTSTPQAATPTFSPVAGTYTSAQTVTISDATSGAKIYYTTNGTTPTTSSTLYSGAITVSSTETVKAIATASGSTTSAVGSAAYTISTATPAATPTFSPVAGTYSSAQTVTISDATSGAKIYYTTNGTTPTTSSTLYSGPITVSSTETVKAIATASGSTTSAVGSAAYSITTTTPAASTTTTLTSSASSITAGSSVTLTATVTSGGAAVTSGTVNFYNGTTLLGPGTVSSNGVATLSTPTLPTGSDSITAIYAGNSSYTTSTSSATTVTVSAATSSFTITANPNTMSIAPGATTGNSTSLTLATTNYSGAVTLSCSGLPANAYCSFPANAGAQTQVVTLSGSNMSVALNIETNVATAPPLTLMQGMPSPFGPRYAPYSPANPSSPLSPILPALAFWWPGSMAGLAAFGRKRGISKTQQRMLQLCLLVLMTGALAAGISGCGGFSSSTPAATHITPAGTSTVTVTATPASGAAQTATIALTIS